MGGQGISNVHPDSDLDFDAWSRQKAVLDYSLLRGMFTYDVPAAIWKELVNGVRQASIANSTSVNGGLNVTGTSGNTVTLQSRRHPRYQPNRGHLYSTSCWLPAENEASTVRDWGLFTDEEGVFFRHKGTTNQLYAVVRRNSVESEFEITPLPSNFDIAKGHLYDIQFQWRGVGDYFFYVDQQLVYSIRNRGVKDASALPTTRNPALPASFEVQGDAVIGAGCVDVSSEGGNPENLNFRSATTGMDITAYETSIGVSVDGVAIMALQIPETFNGSINTRDNIMNRITTFCKDESSAGVWATSDPTVIGGIADNANPTLGWAGVAGAESPVKYMIGGNGSLLSSTFIANKTSANTRLLVTRRVDIDNPNILDNPVPGNTPFYLSAGDFIIVTVRPDGTNVDTGCTIEWAEEI